MGWVVAADGGATNLGSRCGPKHFPELAELRAQFTEAERSKRTKERLAAWKARGPSVLADVTSLETQPFGLRWLQSILKNFRKASVAQELIQELQHRADKGDSIVQDIRQRSKEEIDDLVDRGERRDSVRFETKQLGEIVGLEVFAKINNLTLIVGQQIRKPILEICQTSSDLSTRKIVILLREADDADRLIQSYLDCCLRDWLSFAKTIAGFVPFLVRSPIARQTTTALRWNINSCDVSP